MPFEYMEFGGIEFIEREFESGEPVVTNFINTGENIALIAPPKAGKTIMALQLAIGVATGTDIGEFWQVPTARRVLYIATEGSLHDLQSIVRRLSVAIGVQPPDDMLRIMYTRDVSLNTNDEAFVTIKRRIHEFEPDLLVLDPLYRMVGGDMKDEVPINDTTKRINQLGPDKLCVLLLHHYHRVRKDTYGNPVPEDADTGFYGSGALAWWADAFYGLEFSKETMFGKIGAALERTPKFGQDKEVELLDDKRADMLQFIVQESPLGKYAKDIARRLDDLEGLSIRAIAKAINLKTHETARRAISELVDRGFVERVRLERKMVTIQRIPETMDELAELIKKEDK